MENTEAWKKFYISGKIEDYLEYKNIKYGESKNEDNERSLSDKGDGYRGK